MNELERDNVRQIEGLNQRGGPTLSVVDLIEANTVSVDVAAYLLTCVANGASFLTAANPGGAGKSTVLATLLGFLPPGTRIVTTHSPSVIAGELRRPAKEPTCVLAHEIGSGRWFGYIWGQDVADFFRLMEGPRRIASCQHADTLEELRDILLAPPLNVTDQEFLQLDLLLFMHVDSGRGATRRRVATVHEADGAGHPPVFLWREQGDRFEQTGASRLLPRLADRQGKDGAEVAAEMRRARGFIEELVEDDVRPFSDVRERVIEYYGS